MAYSKKSPLGFFAFLESELVSFHPSPLFLYVNRILDDLNDHDLNVVLASS